MKQEVTNFARFYALLRYMRFGDDDFREELKKSVVRKFTGGRTESLHEVTIKEYNAMCRAMETMTGYVRKKNTSELKYSRSVCLHLMQKIGVDTADWNAVNRYCLSPRIAGKVFRLLSIEDLDTLSLKLRMILKKQKDK